MTHSAAAPNKTERTDITDNLLAVSNAEFLTAIFHAIPEGARPGVVSFPGNPADVPSKVWFARPAGAATPPTANNYFGLSSYFNDEAGQFRRTKKTFAALHAVMLDDLGTKVARERVTLPLSWLIETSVGNYQAGYILADPINDASTADRLMILEGHGEGVRRLALSGDGRTLASVGTEVFEEIAEEDIEQEKIVKQKRGK